MHSLETDAEDIATLLQFLHGRGIPRVILFGHSTGCQDLVAYLRKFAGTPHANMVCASVLQAPISDREYAESLPETPALVARARGLAPGELMPLQTMHNRIPITAGRYLALATRNGADDLFSGDFSDAELAAAVGHVSIPTLLVFSLADEYVPGI
jgi:pimeloyl-ACP methyl ester carboxylesterase